MIQTKPFPRINWIDYLKAGGIFLVVLGHSNCVPLLRKYIYSFHMPLFYFAAGLTISPYKYSSISDLIKDKAKKLLVPYLSITGFTVIFWFFYCQLSGKTFNLLEILAGILIANNDIIFLVNGPCWFIPTLFVSEVLFCIICSFFKTDQELLLCALFFLLFGYTESLKFNHLLMIWHLNCIPVILFYITLSFLIRKWINKEVSDAKNYSIVLSLFLIIIGLIIATVFNGNVSFGGNKYKSILLTIVSSSLSIGGLSLLCIKYTKQTRFSKFLAFIGRNSLIVLAIHKPIIIILRFYIEEFREKSLFSTFVGVIVFVICIPLTYIVDRFFPVLVGRKYKSWGLP